jgi:hypothetical protein
MSPNWTQIVTPTWSMSLIQISWDEIDLALEFWRLRPDRPYSDVDQGANILSSMMRPIPELSDVLVWSLG